MKMNFLSPVQNYKIELTILRGRGLVAKDRHILTRQRTTSDPFCLVFLGLDHKLGQSKTCHKTLDPEWNATFHFEVPASKKPLQVPASTSSFLQSDDQATTQDKTAATTKTISAISMVLIKIYDEDQYTDHDLMGTLLVPIPVPPRSATHQTTQWYDIDSLFVHNAKGSVEIALSIQPVLAKLVPRNLLPSPDTLARWVRPKQATVNEHNVVVENNNPGAKKNYLLAILKQFAE